MEKEHTLHIILINFFNKTRTPLSTRSFFMFKILFILYNNINIPKKNTRAHTHRFTLTGFTHCVSLSLSLQKKRSFTILMLDDLYMYQTAYPNGVVYLVQVVIPLLLNLLIYFLGLSTTMVVVSALVALLELLPDVDH